jgi:hypothetical protein
MPIYPGHLATAARKLNPNVPVSSKTFGSATIGPISKRIVHPVGACERSEISVSSTSIALR